MLLLLVTIFASLFVSVGADACKSLQHALLPTFMRNLSPWLAAGRSIGSEEVAAAFQRCRHDQMPVLIHNGQVHLLKPPSNGPSHHPWMNVVAELAEMAAADHTLSFEFVLNFDDHPTTSNPSLGVPVWGFNRKKPSVDFAVIHYYSVPDRICTNHSHKPWAQRRNAVVSRYTHYCPPAGSRELNGDGERPCPRTYFADVARRVVTVSGIELDIGPTSTLSNQSTYEPYQLEYLGSDGKPVQIKGKLDLSQYGENKYILVSDGVVGAGKFLGALAFGSVVLFPFSTYYEQWFEPALTPWVHYVPVWADTRDDILSVIGWLQSNPEHAQHIALKGREFACERATFPGRACWWKAMAQQYTDSLLNYELDEAWFSSRKAAFLNSTLVTTDTLPCSAGRGTLNGMSSCEWRGPTRPA